MLPFVFANLIFLILVLLLGSFSPAIDQALLPLAPLPAFLLGILAYGLFLALIYAQKRLKLTFVLAECFLFLLFFTFFLGSERLVAWGQLLPALLLMTLYFGVLVVFYGVQSAGSEIRFLIPLLFPFCSSPFCSIFFKGFCLRILLKVRPLLSWPCFS